MTKNIYHNGSVINMNIIIRILKNLNILCNNKKYMIYGRNLINNIKIYMNKNVII